MQDESPQLSGGSSLRRPTVADRIPEVGLRRLDPPDSCVNHWIRLNGYNWVCFVAEASWPMVFDARCPGRPLGRRGFGEHRGGVTTIASRPRWPTLRNRRLGTFGVTRSGARCRWSRLALTMRRPGRSSARGVRSSPGDRVQAASRRGATGRCVSESPLTAGRGRCSDALTPAPSAAAPDGPRATVGPTSPAPAPNTVRIRDTLSLGRCRSVGCSWGGGTRHSQTSILRIRPSRYEILTRSPSRIGPPCEAALLKPPFDRSKSE